MAFGSPSFPLQNLLNPYWIHALSFWWAHFLWQDRPRSPSSIALTEPHPSSLMAGNRSAQTKVLLSEPLLCMHLHSRETLLRAEEQDLQKRCSRFFAPHRIMRKQLCLPGWSLWALQGFLHQQTIAVCIFWLLLEFGSRRNLTSSSENIMLAVDGGHTRRWPQASDSLWVTLTQKTPTGLNRLPSSG